MIFDILNAYRADLQYIAGLLIGFAMLRWGGGPERAVALAFAGLLLAPAIMFRLLASGTMIFGDFAPVYVALDVVALAAFVLIALNANRNYPLWVAGFQIIAVGAHLVKSVVDAVSPFAYVLLAVGPSYCQLALMITGLLRHRARYRRFGTYRDWRNGHGMPLAAILSGKGSRHAG